MKRSVLMIALLLMCLLSLSACGDQVTTGENSPRLESAAITSYNEGGEDSQYVQAELFFDREISVAEKSRDSLRITIGGNRIQEYTLAPGADGKSALLTMSVDSVTNGQIYIGRSTSAGSISDICSQDGKNAAEDFEVQGIVPSGVSLSTVSSEPGRVVKEVVSGWNIRSIAWVGLREDGVLVPVSETMEGEELDGYAAVHGHEFLIEDEADIAAKITETLTDNYNSEYVFSCDGTRLTAEHSGSPATLDVCIYEYLEVNGQRVESSEESAAAPEHEDEHTDEHEDETGTKVKVPEEDRAIQADEQAFLNLLRTSRLSGEVPEEATDLFETVTITGEAMNETQIYSMKDLEELIRLSFVNSKMNTLGLPISAAGYYGLDFKVLLALCGVDTAADDLTILCGTESGSEISLPVSDCMREDTTCLLALSNENGPLDSHDGGEGPICLVLIRDGAVQTIANLKRMTIGPGENPANPEYGYHTYEPYLESADLEFTVEVYQGGAEYLGALKTVSFTTAELEKMMREYPEQVVSGYYSTIGNEEYFRYLGVGGWLDYFEGLDLYWLLTEKAGIENLSGRAELYDRDGALYTQIDDLNYLTQAHETPEEYYVMTSEGLKITGMIPMLATVKNGAPILPEHTHGGEDYIAYNTLNQNLEAIGVSTEVGVVKNHNGPFIACLGNRNGYYGGPEVETGNNCVTMRLYLN